MLYGQGLNNKINSLHDRTLLLLNLFILTFIKERKLRFKTSKKFAAEMFKVYNNMAPGIINDIFKLKTMP